MKKIVLMLFFFSISVSYSQNTDTLKVLSYNLLNFPGSTPNRVDTLKGILDHIKPDIFMVCEITSGLGADNILFNALNTGGQNSYDMANYVDGPNTENMLYYNSDKLGLKEQNVIQTALRDINEYVLYYKSDDIATTTDTTFFYTYVCHLKASQGFEAEREAEAAVLKSYIASRPNRQNIMIGGDFNFYGSSTEPAWNTLLNGSSVSIIDPINTPGDWHVNAGYASIHTQSTRTTSFGGGATGGIDDRFDFILISPDLTNWGNNAQYIDGSYRAVGQDGLHYNNSLIDSPWNMSEPASIIWNLYNMSDHLPIYMEIEVKKVSLEVASNEFDFKAYYSPAANSIIFEAHKNSLDGEVYIYDLSGKLVQTYTIQSGVTSIVLKITQPGIYMMKMEQSAYSLKFSID